MLVLIYRHGDEDDEDKKHAAVDVAVSTVPLSSPSRLVSGLRPRLLLCSQEPMPVIPPPPVVLPTDEDKKDAVSTVPPLLSSPSRLVSGL